MNPDDDHVPPHGMLQLLSLVLVLLGAPARAWARFVRWSDRKLALLERTLEIMHRRGVRLRYVGEDEETTEKRLKLIEWFFDDPCKARRHLGRLHRAGYRIFFRPGNALQHAAPAHAPQNDAPVEELTSPDRGRADSS